MSQCKILSVGGHSRELAPEHVIEGMFTTISCRIEPHGRGTRFPAVMDDLYSGYLPPDRAPEALRELQEIEVALRKMPVSDVVWSLANLRRDDANEPVNRSATNVFDYFADAGGQPLISRLREGVQECLNTNQALDLAFRKEARDGVVGGLILALLGVAWMLLGRAFFPNWGLRSVYSRSAILPLWTFGMDLVMLGVACTIALMFPRIRHWFRRHPPALIATAIVAVVGWLVICARAGFIPD